MLVNHLKNLDPSSKILEDAYGLHILEGDLIMSDVVGTSSNFSIYLMQALGDGEWDGEQGIWFKGLHIAPEDYKFHPGKFTPHPVFKNFTFDDATDTFTANNHGYANNTMVFLRASGAGSALPTGFLPKKIYYLIGQTANTFQLSLTKGGTAVGGGSAGAGVLQVWENDQGQGVDEHFNSDVPHSGTTWARVRVPNIGDFDNKKNPPEGFSGIFRCRRVENYDALGNQTAFGYSPSPGRVAAHLALKRGKLPHSRIEWAIWAAWRDFCAGQELWDYAAQADKPGIGLYGEYYNFPVPANPQDPNVFPDFAGATLVFKRIDPVIDTDLTNGSPGIGVQSEWFLVRWEGKVKAEFAEQYTFYVSHDNGARLWVNGVQIIDRWTHENREDSGNSTFSAAEQLVDIKLEFFESWGTSHIKLEWSSASQPRQVIPTERLFPKAHLKTRYEAHAKFTAPTGLDGALAHVLTNTNSFVQDDGDKLKFYAYEQLTVSFAFDESNIKEGSFKFSQRDLRSALAPLRNSWQADFRDLETQYLEKAEPPVVIELNDLQDQIGRVVAGETVALENMTRYQAEKVLKHIVKRETEMNVFCSFDALAVAFAVLPGDLVTVTHSLAGWAEKTFIVVEATDKSSEETADERSFVLQEWAI